MRIQDFVALLLIIYFLSKLMNKFFKFIIKIFKKLKLFIFRRRGIL